MNDKVILTGAGPRPVATHAIAIYDPRDGRIHHMHHVTVFEGAKVREKHLLEEEAMAHARRMGHDLSGLKVLHVSDFPAHRAGYYRVDPVKLTLEEVPAPPLRLRDLKRKG